MRSLAAAVALALVACGASPPPQKAKLDASMVEYLLDSAATDFRAHNPAERFRDVRVGHVVNEDGSKQYLLCGEFLPAGQSKWTPFVTIKTSGYEQYIGATTWCQRSSFTGEDLTSSLEARFAALGASP